MTTVVMIHCDQGFAYGTCPRQSLPAHTLAEAKSAAEQEGWIVRDNGPDLCPYCSGSRR